MRHNHDIGFTMLEVMMKPHLKDDKNINMVNEFKETIKALKKNISHMTTFSL